MADFHQTGVISTFHRLGPPNLRRLERELLAYSDERPIALVLPCLYTELHGPALKGIVETLEGVPYLRQVVVSLSGAASAEQYAEMRRLFARVPTLAGTPPTIVWNQGPRVAALLARLREEGLEPGDDGKGRATWLAYGYVLATHAARVVAVHDCDILDYRAEMLARLIYPTANPNLSYEFAKGYYGRVTDQLHGRVTRLFMTPLLRALKSVLGAQPLLEYLDSFRYPLAGECAMTTDLARVNRIPADWGLEVGVLAEVYRNCSVKRVCQVDIVDNYDHKHQDLSEDDATRGLHRMVRDIAASLIRNLASYGIEFDEGDKNMVSMPLFHVGGSSYAQFGIHDGVPSVMTRDADGATLAGAIMGRALYEAQPVFRRALHRCAEILDSLIGRPLLGALYGDGDGDGDGDGGALVDTGIAQPALFAVEWAQLELWRALGVQPLQFGGLGHHLVGQRLLQQQRLQVADQRGALADGVAHHDGAKLQRGEGQQPVPAPALQREVQRERGRHGDQPGVGGPARRRHRRHRRRHHPEQQHAQDAAVLHRAARGHQHPGHQRPAGRAPPHGQQVGQQAPGLAFGVARGRVAAQVAAVVQEHHRVPAEQRRRPRKGAGGAADQVEEARRGQGRDGGRGQAFPAVRVELAQQALVNALAQRRAVRWGGRGRGGGRQRAHGAVAGVCAHHRQVATARTSTARRCA